MAVNEYFHRTPTNTGNRCSWTLSFWVKRNAVAADQNPENSSGAFFNFYTTQAITPYEAVGNFNSAGTIQLGRNEGGSDHELNTVNVFKDTGNWMHILVKWDTTKIVSQERLKLYVNGVLEDDVTGSFPSRDYNGAINTKVMHTIGTVIAGGVPYAPSGPAMQYFDYFLIDGQALDADVFGFYKDGDGYISVGSTQATDFRPGQWVPHTPRKIKSEIERLGGFGANGFYLPMNDSSNPGADFHTTPNSIITLKGEDLPQPRNGAPTTSDSYVSQLRPEVSTLGFDGCVKMDGAQRLTVADVAALDLGTGDFTIEGFYYLKDEGGYHSLFDFRGPNATGLYPALFKDLTEDKLYYYVNGTTIDDIPMRYDEWMHVVICRSSGTTRAFVDGKLAGSYTDTTNYISSDLYIGMSTSNSHGIYGFVSNFRIVKGTALYTANFTPPTSPLENVTNTILLCANSSTSATASTVTPSTISAVGSPIATRNELTGSIVLAVPGITGGQSSGYGDYSANIKGSGTNNTVTPAGNAGIAATDSYYGSAIFLDGNGDELNIAASSDFDFGGGDFTVEAWINPRAYNSGNMDWIGKNGGGPPSIQAFEYGILSTGQLVFYHSDGSNYSNSGVYGLTLPNGSAPLNQWTHVVGERHGNTFTAYINGSAAGTVSNFLSGASMPNTTVDLCIGADSVSTGTSWHWDGYIQDLRIYKGVAKYKGGFDVPKSYTPVGMEEFRTTADTCKNNFATWNVLTNYHTNAHTLSDGNLKITNTNHWRTLLATHGVSSGKWYYEIKTVNDADYLYVGWGNSNTNTGNYPSEDNNAWAMRVDEPKAYHDQTGDNVQVSLSPAFTNADICGVAFDADNGRIWWSRNNVWLTSDGSNDGNPAAGTKAIFSDIPTGVTYHPIAGAYTETATTNFGQNPSFSGGVTPAGTQTDENGKGLFKYAPPTGFLALCEDNLPTPAIADPGKHFKTVLWTGDGNDGRSITGVGFKPDFVWIKNRADGAVNSFHSLSNSITPGRLFSNDTQAEDSFKDVGSFDNDGMTINYGSYVNTSGGTYVAWCWKAGGAALSNGNGSITSQVSANQTAGFSIVSYTGNGISGATIGHGLNKKPSVVIIKNRDTAGTSWPYITDVIDGSIDILYLNDTSTFGNSSSLFTSDTFSVGSGNNGNQNTKKFIAYCWAEIEGFSKFGSYEGNNNADGPFIYCGFKPAFIMFKNADSVTNWVMVDSSRDPTNTAANDILFPDASIAANTGANKYLDFCSNGFKLRGTSSAVNAAATYVFMAFAESPYQTANAK